MTNIPLSNRVNSIKPSATIAVSTLARELRAAGRDVIGLGAGEPDFATPENIQQAAIEAMRNGMTKYTPADGIPELKSAIVDKFERENQLTYTPANIIVSNGAKQCIINLLIALLNENDEVVIVAPYWVSYTDMTVLSGGKPVVVNTTIEQGFKLQPQQLREAITSHTKLLMLNSPNNPTGIAYTRQDLEELAEVLLENPHVYVVTDDIYEHILWSGEPFCNIVNVCPDLKDRTVVVNGVSKAYAMTGWRIGFAASPEPITAAMRKIQSQTTSNPNSIAQAAAVEALNGPQDTIQYMAEQFKSRHDFVISSLNQVNGMNCLAGDGAFYAFPDCREIIDSLDGIDSDLALSEYILNEAEVAIVPGSAFGGAGHIRLSFATDMETLQQAMARLHDLFGKRR
jgi:aspartate aminotransferase